MHKKKAQRGFRIVVKVLSSAYLKEFETSSLIIIPNGTAVSMSKKMFSSRFIFKLVLAFPSLYVKKSFSTSFSTCLLMGLSSCLLLLHHLFLLPSYHQNDPLIPGLYHPPQAPCPTPVETRQPPSALPCPQPEHWSS